MAENRFLFFAVQSNVIRERQGNIRCGITTHMTDQAGRSRIIGRSNVSITGSCHFLGRKGAITPHTVHQQGHVIRIRTRFVRIDGNSTQRYTLDVQFRILR